MVAPRLALLIVARTGYTKYTPKSSCCGALVKLRKNVVYMLSPQLCAASVNSKDC
jgi:hypothetical protein